MSSKHIATTLRRLSLLAFAASWVYPAGCAYQSQPADHKQKCASATNNKRCPDDYHCAVDDYCWHNGEDPGIDSGAADSKDAAGGPKDGSETSGSGGRIVAGSGGVTGGGGVTGSGGETGTGGVTGNGGVVGPGGAGVSATGGTSAVDGGLTATDAPSGTGGSSMGCTAAQKLCYGACVALSDPTYGCGASTCDSSSCPTSAGATLTCQGSVCVVGACGAGTKNCDGKCVALTDPAYGCGAATCDAKGCPSAVGATLVCQTSICVIGSCPSGTKKCADKCVSVTDPTFGCGATTCDATSCPAAGTGSLVCQGTTCVIGTCGAGTKKCGQKCVPLDANNGCGDTARCTACASNETCTGSPTTTCQCVPNNTAACSGKACGPATNNCGQAVNCTNTCMAPKICNGGSAGVNGCGCTPMTKAAACGSRKCGSVSDGCAGNLDCGACATNEMCNTTTGLCACVPLTKATACNGKMCGSVSDGCGAGTIACDNKCTADTANACGLDGTCNTNNTCHYRASGTACGSASCSGSPGKLTPAGKCNGSGTCQPGTATNCSGNLPCASATACSMTCTARSTTGCPQGYKCVNGNSCASATVSCGNNSCPVANGGGQCCVTDPNSTGSNTTFTCQGPGSSCSSLSIIPCNSRAECPASQICCALGNGPSPSHWDVACRSPSDCQDGTVSFGNQVCDPSFTSPSECLTGTCLDSGLPGTSLYTCQ